MFDNTLRYRPAAAADRAALQTFHDRCSPDSRLHRWRAPLPTIPERYLDDALSGRGTHVCLLAVEPTTGDVVAMASAVADDRDDWQVGALVRDDRQRRGIGTRLLAELVRAVRAHGAAALVADLMPDRRWLLPQLTAWGVPTYGSGGGGIHVRIALPQPVSQCAPTVPDGAVRPRTGGGQADAATRASRMSS